MKIVDDLKDNLTTFTIIKKIVKQELCFKEKDALSLNLGLILPYVFLICSLDIRTNLWCVH